jgi:hypothetical protein
MLDLWQDNQAIAKQQQPGEGRELPATFGQTFDAAWGEGQMFSDSLAHINARSKAIDDYVNQVRNVGGNIDEAMANRINISGELSYDDRFQAANTAAVKLKSADPTLAIGPLSDEDLEQRAAAVSAKAREDYEAMRAREKSLGGKIGMAAGGLASSAVDPMNLIAVPVAPELELGIAASAVLWGAYGLGSQAVNEAINAGYRERVAPGYGGEIGGNLLEATLGGAVAGGGLRTLGKLWSGLKGTTAIPQATRDAANVIESEANIAGSNVLPGAAGEAAHRESMATAISQILGELPVDVKAASRELVGRIEREAPFTLPTMNEQAIRLISEQAQHQGRLGEIDNQLRGMAPGDLSAADRLNRLQAVDDQIANTTDRGALRALNARRDQILVDTTPEALRAAASPIEQRRALELEQGQLQRRVEDIVSQQRGLPAETPPRLPAPQTLFGIHENRIDGLMDLRGRIAKTATSAAEARAISAAAGELPFNLGMIDMAHDFYAKRLAGGLRQLGIIGGHDMGADEARELATRVMASRTDDEARGIIQSVTDRPQTMRDTLPSPEEFAAARKLEAATAAEPPMLTAKEMEQTLASPQHEAAMRADLDRARATGDVKIPVGVDQNGNPIYGSLDKALKEVDDYNAIAEQVQACAAPQPEVEPANA